MLLLTVPTLNVAMEINSQETNPADLGVQFSAQMVQNRSLEFRRRRHPRYNSNVRRRVAIGGAAAAALAGSPRRTKGWKLNSTPPWHDVMKYMVPSWLVIVALKYQEGSTATLFTEDSLPTWCFVTSSCVYWLIAGTMKLMPDTDSKWFLWFIRAALAAGLLSVLSLVSILLPYKVWFVLLTVWLLLLLVTLAWPLFSLIYNHICTRITRVLNKICALGVWPGGCGTVEVTDLPV